MAVTFVAEGGLVVNTTTASLALTAPIMLGDDIMIAVIMAKSLSNAISPPDGSWTEIGAQADNDCSTSGNDHRAAAYWKRAELADSLGTFTFTKASDDNNVWAGIIGTWRGAETSGSALDATAPGALLTANATDPVSFPAFDPTGTDSHIIYVAFYANDLTAFSAAMSSDTNPDCTIRWDYETLSGDDLSIACTSGDSDGSNIDARLWNSNSTTDAGSTGYVFALKTPAVAGGHAHSKVGQPILHSKLRGLVAA